MPADFSPLILRTIHTREDRASRLEAGAMALAHEALTSLVLELDASVD